MNIVVPMKQIPDLQQIRMKDRKPILVDVPQTYGDIDKNALEVAVQLKETRDADDEVIVISIGNDEISDTVKEAMAAGGDKSILIEDEDASDLDSSSVAEVIAQAIPKIDDAQLIVFGEGSGDNYSGQVGSRVAQILGYPQVGYVVDVKIEGEKIIATRALEDVLEIVEMDMPAVVIVAGGLNEPRTPSVMQVLKAGKKPKDYFDLDDFSLSEKEGPISTLSNLAPDISRKQVEVRSVSELVETLRSEGLIEV